MKKIIALAISIAFTLGFAFAQKAPKSPEQKAEKRAQKLATELGLSAEQIAQVQAAILERMNAVAPIKAKFGPNGDKKAMRAELKPIRENFKSKMEGILTPEQKTKLAQIHAANKEKRKAKKAGAAPAPASGPGPMDALEEGLDD